MHHTAVQTLTNRHRSSKFGEADEEEDEENDTENEHSATTNVSEESDQDQGEKVEDSKGDFEIQVTPHVVKHKGGNKKK